MRRLGLRDLGAVYLPFGPSNGTLQGEDIVDGIRFSTLKCVFTVTDYLLLIFNSH